MLRRAADPIVLPPSTGGCRVGSTGCQISETIHVRPEAISSRSARQVQKPSGGTIDRNVQHSPMCRLASPRGERENHGR
jgi:hypothetical protein